MKLCKNCEYFHIRQQPTRPHWDTGLAECKKYNIVVDFYDMKKFNNLSCVEGGRRDGKVLGIKER